MSPLCCCSLERAIDFYTHVLNARVLRHEEYDSDCPATCNGKPPTPSSSSAAAPSSNWSKTIVGLSDERSFCFELIYNYSSLASNNHTPTPSTPSSSSHASPFRYVTINIPGAASRAKTAGWRIDTVDDGEGNALAVVCGPDGMMFRCIENAISPRASSGRGGGSPGSSGEGWGGSGSGVRDNVVSVSLRVKELDASVAYYVRALGMSVLRGVERTSEGWRVGDYLQLGYNERETRIELIHSGSTIERSDADTSRLAFSTTSVSGIHERGKAAQAAGSGQVLHKPTTLKTPGKADVEVVVLTDPDGHELAFVDVEGWLRLSEEKEEGKQIDWKERERRSAAATPHGSTRSLATAHNGGGGDVREEKHEIDELKHPGVMIDESEYEEGGDEKQTDDAVLDRGRPVDALGAERLAPTVGQVEESTDKTWTSSPHPKPQSPSDSRLNMN